MMDWTDRHCRVLHRLLSARARLYTEMVTADAILHGDRERLIGFSAVEHPVALQLGGSEPAKLAAAARIGAEFGYDEINLNVGCPSDRVQSGCFGAALMREPARVADCVAAMRAAVSIPVTVKCRIGVDDQDPADALPALVEACAQAGVDTFAVHARKAWLSGLSPRENREVPPLDYGLVYALKRARPELTIIINGGIGSLDEAQAHLAHVDGVMLGPRGLSDAGDPCRTSMHASSARPRANCPNAVEAYVDYVAARLADGAPLNAMTKHMLGLFHGRPGARLFRRHLSENATRKGAGISRACARRLPISNASAPKRPRSSDRTRRLRDISAGACRCRGTSRACARPTPGFRTTTTSDGLFEEARTRPQVPSSSVTRTPLTVTRRAIFWPRSFSPFAASCSYSLVIAVDDLIFVARRDNTAPWSASPRSWAARRSARRCVLPPARSSISSTAIAATMESS